MAEDLQVPRPLPPTSDRLTAVRGLIDELRKNPLFMFDDDKIEFRETVHGLGLFALQPLEARSIVASVPGTNEFSFKNAVQSSHRKACRIIDKMVKDSDRHLSFLGGSSLKLAVALMLGMCAESSSAEDDWRGLYLATLPRSLSNIVKSPLFPSLWSEEDLAVAKGTAFHCRIMHERRAVDAIFHEEILPMVRKLRALDDKPLSQLPADDEVLRELFDRAVAIAVSRAFGSSGSQQELARDDRESILVPIADMANGRFEGGHNVDKEVNRIELSGLPHATCHTLVTVRHASAGDELFVDYGNLSGSMCLMKYGCIDLAEGVASADAPESLDDEVHIWLDHLFPLPERYGSESFRALKTQVLENLEITQKEMRQWPIRITREELVEHTHATGLAPNHRQIAIVVTFPESERGQLEAICQTGRLKGNIRVAAIYNEWLDWFDRAEVRTSIIPCVATGPKAEALNALRRREVELLRLWRSAVWQHFGAHDWGPFSLPFDRERRNKESDVSRCWTCGAKPRDGASLSRCAKCRIITYCDATCQKMDWKVHKPECAKWRNK